jgi:hypothetical protein
MLNLLRRLRDKKYVLKAKTKDGEWEDIQEFDRYVGVSEIRDIIDELREQGYYSFRLEEKTKERTKLLWVRTYSSPKKRLLSTLNELKETLELINTIKEAFTEKVDTLSVIGSMASVLLSFRKICEQYPELCGIRRSEEDMFKTLLNMIISSRIATPQIAPQVVPQAVPQASPAPAPRKIVLPEPSPEAVEKINKIVEEAVEEVSKSLVGECEVIGECLEETSSSS